MTQFYAVIVKRTSKWDWSKPADQQPGFSNHLAFMNGLKETGFIALAGLMMTTEDVLFIFRAESEDEVRERLGQDPWQRDGTVRIERIENLAVSIGNL